MSATDPSRSLHRIGPEHNHVVVAAWRERDKAIAERDAERGELDKIREFVGGDSALAEANAGSDN